MKALCVFRFEGRILVAPGYDSVKQERFFRPLGGAIEFGETAVEAIRREIDEELRQDIGTPALLGVLENRFVFDGEPGHEILFVFDAKFGDLNLYGQASIPFAESDGSSGEAIWANPDDESFRPLYPEGLISLLDRHGARVGSKF